MRFFCTVKNSFLNHVRRHDLSPIEKKERANASAICSSVKLLSVASMISALALTVLSIFALPTGWMIFSFCALTIVAILSYDSFSMATRTQNLLHDTFRGMQYENPLSSAEKINFLTKGTVILGPILQLSFLNKY